MHACWSSGGPEWLFGVVLGAGLAALICVVTAAGFLVTGPVQSLFVASQRSWSWRRAVWPVLSAAWVVYLIAQGGFAVADLLFVGAPMLVAAVAASADSRRHLTWSSVDPSPGPRPRPVFSLSIGALAAATAAGALVTELVLGGPC
ncbi:MAG: hypothetical protein QOI76_3235 [Frankiales bacterium]|nr:hypothetical protein [Frankiales bacterium]